MKTVGVVAGALVSAAATVAFAQSPPPPTPSEGTDLLTAPVRAPDHAFELGVEAGYTQGFGAATSDRRLGAGPGASVGASLGYRITPYWSIAVRGQYQAYGATGEPASGATLRGATADVHGTYHLSPYHRFDPYLDVGAGYRLFAESPADDTEARLSHRLELGKIEVGLDVRSSESVAISPVVGVDVNLFMLRSDRGMDPAAPGNKSVSTFIFAGVKGRFDVGGARENEPAP